jgi:hypothetical protein
MNSVLFRRCLTIALRFLLLSIPSFGFAQSLQAPISSTRDYGMSAVIGDPQMSSALFNNPAGMSRGYTYSVEGQYIRGGLRQMNVLGGSVVDSKTQPSLAVGVGYGYGFTDESADFKIESHDARLALSKAVVEKHVFAGVGFRYVRETVGEGETAQVLDGFTLDPGALFVLTESFSIGIVGQNLMKVKGLPRRAGGGVAIGAQGFILDGDVLVDFTSNPEEPKPIYKIGTEFLVGESVPLRAGFIEDTATEARWVSGGIGFLQVDGPRGNQLNLSYKQRIDTDDVYFFAVGMTVFL